MKFQISRVSIFFIILFLFTACGQKTDTQLSELKAEFASPPDEVKPFTWWHWIHGNITKEGITKDLEWMKDFGLGGAIVFNVGRFSDEVPRPVPFQSEAWWEMVDHAIAEADRLGLKLGFHNCDGWSHSGGPWMEEDESMKKMVWTETIVKEGERDIILPQPETIRDYYKEIATLALPVAETGKAIPVRRISSNMASINVEALTDGDLQSSIRLQGFNPEQPLLIDVEFEHPAKVSSLTLVTGAQRIRDIVLSLEVSDDGEQFRKVKEFKSRARGILGWRTEGAGSTMTFSFPAEKASFFRLSISRSNSMVLTDLILSGTDKVDLWEAKAGQVQYTEHGGGAEFFYPDPERHGEGPSEASSAREAVIDLSDRLAEDGSLDWIPPAGTWKVIRVGQTTTGKTNAPSTLEGRGLEADKLSPDALTKHYSNFMKLLIERDINENTNSLAYTEIDSWEAGPQNWTNGLMDIFSKLNSYDMKPYLPVLAGGHVVNSYELSERFLWDFRKTLAHLIREGCFRHLAELADGDGLVAFSEGSGRQQYLYDPINFQSTAPIPKGEFWIGPDHGALLPDGSPMMAMRPRIDCKVASSVAHIYGGQLAASESFTGGQPAWYFGPFENKMLGDQAFTMGVNWIVLHTSVHQPYTHLKPGFSLGAAGSHFHRNNIIYKQSQAWISYMTRCQYMLRQGVFVADVLCFTGEDVPNYLGFRHELSVPLPGGYDYDGCNLEILKRADVKEGNIILPTGMEYRVLLMPDRPYMSLDLLSTIQGLIKKGATVIGPAPQHAPGLKAYPNQDKQVADLAAEIWGDCKGAQVKEHAYGKGRVIWGQSFEEIFEGMKVLPDFQFTGADIGDEITYIHRRVGETDIYFVANAEPEVKQLIASFRAEGKIPQLFDPGTGDVIQLAAYDSQEGTIEVPLKLDPYGSAFVVLVPGKQGVHISSMKGPDQALVSRAKDGTLVAEISTSGKYRTELMSGELRELLVDVPGDFSLEGAWNISFPHEDAEKRRMIVSELFPWNESEDPVIRFFSGTATYSKQWNLPADFQAEDQRIYLNLGRVQKIARVRINGEELPELWKLPFRTDISKYLKDGNNELLVEVTNTWANRMIGDEEMPADLNYPGFHRNLTEIPDWLDGSKPRPTDRETFAITKFFFKGDKLQESGLLGPVVLQSSMLVTLK